MIRSIIYLDEPKLFSLSSQVFEGLTEYLLTESGSSEEKTEAQKGPVASGRTLADAIKSTSTSVERRVLHDHAFAVFEKRLLETGNLLDVNQTTIQDGIPERLESTAFVRISAEATFIDAAKLNGLLRIFNRLGEAITYITKNDEIRAGVEALEAAKGATKDKGKQALLSKQLKELADPGRLAREAGLYQDPKFLENLGMLTEYAYADQFELHQRLGSLLFSSCLKRESLREPEGLLIRKFSRKTEKKLVVLGFVTQTAAAPNTATPGEDVKPTNMKEAITNMIDHIALMESTLSGKNLNEVIVDPIAVYVSL